MYVKLITRVYRSAGFIIYMSIIDKEFECSREALLFLTPAVKLNVISESKYIPKTERSIWVIKEKVRTEHTILLYRYMP